MADTLFQHYPVRSSENNKEPKGLLQQINNRHHATILNEILI